MCTEMKDNNNRRIWVRDFDYSEIQAVAERYADEYDEYEYAFKEAFIAGTLYVINNIMKGE